MGRKDKKSSTAGGPDYVLAYSTDPAPPQRCKQCLRPISDCRCMEATINSMPQLNPVARIEKKGRGGKSVTVLCRLPAYDQYLKELCKFLKQSLGSGGTHYIENGEGVIELQGEWREEAPALAKKFKRAP